MGMKRYNIIGLPYSYFGSNMRMQRPHVLLFDIGGVCVVSPFQAILDYEKQHSIPIGYINFSIRELTPNGSWHKLERGEIPNDANYFRMFKADLERPDLWAKFHQKSNNSNPPP